MAGYNAASLMPFLLDEKPLQYNPSQDGAIMQTSTPEAEKSWSKTPGGQGAIEGAKLGMQSGDMGNTLISAGVGNMLGEGALTAGGGAAVAGGMILKGAEQANAADYANKKLVADQEAAARSAQVAGLYRMMGNNFNTTGTRA